MKLNFIQTMDFVFEDIDVLNCNTIEELENKIKENEVVEIDNGGTKEYINSTYIMFFA